MRKLGLLCALGLLTLVAVQPAAAQDYYKNAFRIQVVNEQFSEENIDFHLTGFGIRYSRFIHQNVALAGEYGATFGDPFGLDSNNQWLVGGLQVYPYNGEHAQVYGQFLGGWDRLRIGEGEGSSSNGGTIVVGGGLNVFVHPNVGFNVEANYKSTWLFDSRQDVGQFRAGVVFRWGEDY